MFALAFPAALVAPRNIRPVGWKFTLSANAFGREPSHEKVLLVGVVPGHRLLCPHNSDGGAAMAAAPADARPSAVAVGSLRWAGQRPQLMGEVEDLIPRDGIAESGSDDQVPGG